jgi:hypothetical protein
VRKTHLTAVLFVLVASMSAFGKIISPVHVSSAGLHIRGPIAEHIFFESWEGRLIDMREAGFLAVKEASANRFNCEKKMGMDFICRCDLPGQMFGTRAEYMTGNVELVDNDIIFEGALAQFLWERAPLARELKAPVGADEASRFFGLKGRCYKPTPTSHRCVLEAHPNHETPEGLVSLLGL